MAEALVTKPRPELTSRQAESVDLLKKDCPGFAVMRTRVLSFRMILQNGKVSTLHRWMERGSSDGNWLLETIRANAEAGPRAVEAGIREKWSSGPVEGQANRLKALKRQMYGRVSVGLLRARLLPLAPGISTVLQRK